MRLDEMRHFRCRVKYSPQAIVEGLHAVFGDAVRTAEGADPTECAGHIHHPATSLLDEREDTKGDVDHAH